jgi:hypothetical protein
MRDPDLGWCGQCLARVQAPVPPGPEPLIIVTAIRGDDGLPLPTWARIAVSLGALVGAGLLAIGFGPWWGLGGALWALGATLLTAYGVATVLLVARLWSPPTPPPDERIVVLDRSLIERVERQHAALAARRPTQPTAA